MSRPARRCYCCPIEDDRDYDEAREDAMSERYDTFLAEAGISPSDPDGPLLYEIEQSR